MLRDKYEAEYTLEDIMQNEKVLKERLSLYKSRGLDFLKNRDFIIRKADLSKRRILDVGTGRGISSISLAEAGHMVTSIDIEDKMLHTASLNIASRELTPRISLYKMDAFSMDFEGDNFGAVFVIEALHHIKDVKALMKELDRVLISSGAIVLSDFNSKGRAIVDAVHREEGHIHSCFNTGPEEAHWWLDDNGYSLEYYDEDCHWLLIGRKA